ncbi:hypothetical protein [Acinetobacter sp.]|uniref:hypothetical protein n=1 Tax=Acinetobacter sp. TaxID=472 RepID=UPI0035AED243
MSVLAELFCFNTPKNLFLNKNLQTYLAPHFAVMIKELYEFHGMTAEKIAFVLPVSGASTVSEWARGGIPNYDNGNSMIELWMSLTNKELCEIPRLDRHFINNNWRNGNGIETEIS